MTDIERLFDEFHRLSMDRDGIAGPTGRCLKQLWQAFDDFERGESTRLGHHQGTTILAMTTAAAMIIGASVLSSAKAGMRQIAVDNTVELFKITLNEMREQYDRAKS